ncbi:hypothetical protein GF359_01980 [candidate division WOR-3 bacterium]|uniref:YbbR-like domain-containing protein n=1 Tax=candidate division WOR-3 bacterium TaxID=2052148 RepID=A0A9D5K7V4_UNCW3|nr:hypothetical protein [candidate division WOR-3 bacterium]MBD3363963.1 hypothetical protein [candidate division WOR-3 bacterium]
MTPRRILKWIVKDWWLKLIALLAAIFLWFFAKLELEYTRQIKVPLDFSPLPKEYFVAKKDVDSVLVDVKSKGKHLLRMWWKNRKEPIAGIIMPVSSVNEGTERIRIGPENVNLPAEIRVISLNPYQINLKIQRRVDRKVPIIVLTEGKTSGEFTVHKFKHPPNVHIYGSSEEVKATTQLFTEALNIDSLEGFPDSTVVMERYVAVEIPEELNLFVEPESVLVKFTVEPKAIKEIKDIPIKLEGKSAHRQVILFHDEVDLTLEGPRSLLEDLNPEDVEVTVSVGALDTGHHKVPATFSLEPGITLVKSDPDRFHLKIK